jgi:hypothetical protein
VRDRRARLLVMLAMSAVLFAGCAPAAMTSARRATNRITRLVAVPLLAGMDCYASGTAIGDAELGFGPVDTEYCGTVPAGEILSQEPVAGSLVPTGTPVSLVFSMGPAHDGAQMYETDPATSTVRGTIRTAVGFDESVGGRVTFCEIVLDPTIDVAADDWGGPDRGVKVMELALSFDQPDWDSSYAAFKKRWIGRRAETTGSLFRAENMHHLTPVLILVDNVRAAS